MEDIGNSKTSNILLVEDETSLSQLISETLSKKGYSVLTCASAGETIAALGMDESQISFPAFKPDLLIIDIGLPDMKGFELLKIIKKKSSDVSRLPYIFISGQFIQQEDIFEGLDLGAFDYLCKPFDMDLLAYKVRNAIEFSQKIQQNTLTEISHTHEILDIKETADFLRLTEKTVYSLVKEGKIPALKIGGQWRFSRELLEEMFRKTSFRHSR